MYQAQISRKQPSAILFLVDQSGSMSETVDSHLTLSHMVANSINTMISDLVLKCTKSDGIRDYFDLAVIAYGKNKVYNGFKGALSNRFFHSISEVGNNPLYLQNLKRDLSGQNGDSKQMTIKKPLWFEPAAGGRTPMHAAYKKAAYLLADWCDNHPTSFPPMLINITDGESTDKDPEDIAIQLQKLHTNDGKVLVYNLHLSISSPDTILYADDEINLVDDYAKKLFRMSSLLTPLMRELAQNEGFLVTDKSRGYAYNADVSSLMNFLDIGTRASNLR